MDSATSICGGSFRFLDLPRELRDKVYQYLLCTFLPPKGPVTDEHYEWQKCHEYIQTVHPEILRTSKQIHREAYDIMVKTNRFVHVKSKGIDLFNASLEATTKRIICRHKDELENFRGYTMLVDVTANGSGWVPDTLHGYQEFASRDTSHAMILWEDIDGLIRVMMNLNMPNLEMMLSVAVVVGPITIWDNMPTNVLSSTASLWWPEGSLPSWKVSNGPLTIKTQKDLLAPFKIGLHGLKSIDFIGVEKDLAKSIKADIAKDQWTDHQQVIEDLKSAKDRGKGLFKQQDLRAATEIWISTRNEIDCIHYGSSWPGLCERGETPFVDSVAEIYFQLCMNVAHVHLQGVEKPIAGFPSHCTEPRIYLQIAKDQIDRIISANKEGYWMEGHEWQRSDEQEAKLSFREALCLKAVARLEDDPLAMKAAHALILDAERLAPNDQAILKQKGIIKAAMEQMCLAMSQYDFADFMGTWENDIMGSDDDDSEWESTDGDASGTDDSLPDLEEIPGLPGNRHSHGEDTDGSLPDLEEVPVQDNGPSQKVDNEQDWETDGSGIPGYDTDADSTSSTSDEEGFTSDEEGFDHSEPRGLSPEDLEYIASVQSALGAVDSFTIGY